MEDQDCVLSVIYSIKMKSEKGESPQIKKKITRKFSSNEAPVILEEIRSFSNKLNQQQENIIPLSVHGFLFSCKKFMEIWKQTYYEMLKI
jgi:hypothetical protein